MSMSVKGYLRTAYNKDPDEFERLITSYLKQGDSAFSADKPGTNAGSPKRIGDTVAALMLAKVWLRPESISKQEFYKDMADRGAKWRSPNPKDPQNRESDFKGQHFNKHTIKTHIQQLEKRYQTDTEFAAKVDMYCGLLPMLDD